MSLFRIVAVGFVIACACSAPQRASEREAITVAVDLAKATCRAVETPAAASLAEVTIPGYGAMAITVARLVCGAFIDDRAAVAVTVQRDGSVTTVDAPSSGGGELLPTRVYQ